MDCILPGSSVQISQARILKWVAISFSRISSWPRDQTWVSCIAGRVFTLSHLGSPWSVPESESEVIQSSLTLCDPMDCSLPDSCIHGIFQARTLEWAAISFYRGSFQPRDQTWVFRIVGRRFHRLSHQGSLSTWYYTKYKYMITAIAFPFRMLNARKTMVCFLYPRISGDRYGAWHIESESHSVAFNSLQPHELCSPWNSPGQDTGVGSLSLLQGIFPTPGSNPGLQHCGQILYQLSYQGSPRILEWAAYPFSRGSSWPRIWTRVSCNASRFFTNWAIMGALDI